MSRGDTGTLSEREMAEAQAAASEGARAPTCRDLADAGHAHGRATENGLSHQGLPLAGGSPRPQRDAQCRGPPGGDQGWRW